MQVQLSKRVHVLAQEGNACALRLRMLVRAHAKAKKSCHATYMQGQLHAVQRAHRTRCTTLRTSQLLQDQAKRYEAEPLKSLPLPNLFVCNEHHRTAILQRYGSQVALQMPFTQSGAH